MFSSNPPSVALYHGGRTWLVYSASYCWSNYKLGMLELVGSDPMVASNWVKNSEPIFQAADGDYGYETVITSPCS